MKVKENSCENCLVARMPGWRHTRKYIDFCHN